MDQPPSTSPELSALRIRHFYFHDPKNQPPSSWPPFLAPVLATVVVVFILGCLILRHILRRSVPETPAGAPQPQSQPQPEDDTTSSQEEEGDASADPEGAIGTSRPREVELGPVGPPKPSCPICLESLV